MNAHRLAFVVALLVLCSCRHGVKMEHCRSLTKELSSGAVVQYKSCAEWWAEDPRDDQEGLEQPETLPPIEDPAGRLEQPQDLDAPGGVG